MRNIYLCNAIVKHIFTVFHFLFQKNVFSLNIYIFPGLQGDVSPEQDDVLCDNEKVSAVRHNAGGAELFCDGGDDGRMQ